MFEVEECEPDESLPELRYRVVNTDLDFVIGVFDKEDSFFTPIRFRKRHASMLCKQLNGYIDQAINKRRGVAN